MFEFSLPQQATESGWPCQAQKLNRVKSGYNLDGEFTENSF